LRKAKKGIKVGVILANIEDGIAQPLVTALKNLSNEFETPIINRDWLIDTIVLHKLHSLDKFVMFQED
jgi:hypothetical protein